MIEMIEIAVFKDGRVLLNTSHPIDPKIFEVVFEELEVEVEYEGMCG